MRRIWYGFRWTAWECVKMVCFGGCNGKRAAASQSIVEHQLQNEHGRKLTELTGTRQWRRGAAVAGDQNRLAVGMSRSRLGEEVNAGDGEGGGAGRAELLSLVPMPTTAAARCTTSRTSFWIVSSWLPS